MKPLSFAFLFLACLLNFTPADAIPTRTRRQLPGNSGMVTMPLKRLHVPRGADLHPQVVSSSCPVHLVLNHPNLFDCLVAFTTTH
jgi:hypothetical protein